MYIYTSRSALPQTGASAGRSAIAKLEIFFDICVKYAEKHVDFNNLGRLGILRTTIRFPAEAGNHPQKAADAPHMIGSKPAYTLDA